MRNMHIQAALVFGVFFFGALGAAHADSTAALSSTAFSGAPLALDGHIGLGTPQGSLGVSLTFTATDYFAVTAGAGLGLSGPQLSVMPRLQLPLGDEFALGFGAGVSATPGYEQVFTLSTTDRADVAFWQNAEASIVYQAKNSGFRVGLYGGATNLFSSINPTDDDEPTRTLSESVEVYPYAGFFVGAAL